MPATPHDLVDWHYCGIGDVIAEIRQDRIHSTDCAPALVRNLTETDVREATHAAVTAGARLLLYDTGDNPTHQHVLDWMAAELPS